ncbi:hypothetical protein ACFQ2B_20310 [Streptomyces stramineus]
MPTGSSTEADPGHDPDPSAVKRHRALFRAVDRRRNPASGVPTSPSPTSGPSDAP